MIGPSGCGKSTLLRMIAGWTAPPPGRSRASIRSDIAFVFQDAHLLPWRNVLRNVALPLELRGVASATRRRGDGAIEQVGLTDAIRRYPASFPAGCACASRSPAGARHRSAGPACSTTLRRAR
jgi:NitT/TauT family transport system ATP-binding protein